MTGRPKEMTHPQRVMHTDLIPFLRKKSRGEAGTLHSDALSGCGPPFLGGISQRLSHDAEYLSARGGRGLEGKSGVHK